MAMLQMSLPNMTKLTHPLLPLSQAVRLVIKVMSKTMDSTTLTPDKVELATLSRTDAGRLVYRVFTAAELQPVLDAVNSEQAREKAAAS